MKLLCPSMSSSCQHKTKLWVLLKGYHKILHGPSQENELRGLTKAYKVSDHILPHAQGSQRDDAFYLKGYLIPKMRIKYLLICLLN